MEYDLHSPHDFPLYLDIWSASHTEIMADVYFYRFVKLNFPFWYNNKHQILLFWRETEKMLNIHMEKHKMMHGLQAVYIFQKLGTQQPLFSLFFIWHLI